MSLKVAGAQGVQLKHHMSPGDHPYVELVRTWLKESGVEPDEVEKEEEEFIRWRVTAGDGMSVFVGIYKNGKNEFFFWLECTINRVALNVEHAVLRWVMETNATLCTPFRLALVEQDLIAVQCRAYCDGFTAEHFKLRLDSLIPFSESTQEQLTARFGLKPAITRKANVEK